MSQILENYLQVKKKVELAALKAGRNPNQIKIVAVSKTHSVDAMRELRDSLAARGEEVIFGENYVQEFKQKKDILGSGFECHLIGPLQSNKAKEAVKLFNLIESVHSASLAKVLDREARKIGKPQAVLLQINISNDDAKSGFQPAQVLDFLERELAALSNLEFKGFMTITRLYPEPEMARADFRALRILSEQAQKSWPDSEGKNFELSMGMSADFEIAVEEGATLVRVGTAIFGERI